MSQALDSDTIDGPTQTQLFIASTFGYIATVKRNLQKFWDTSPPGRSLDSPMSELTGLTILTALGKIVEQIEELIDLEKEMLS